MNQQVEAEAPETNAFAIKPADFKDIVKQLKKSFTDLVAVNQEIVLIPKASKIPLADGRMLGRLEVSSLNSQYLKELDNLGKYFSQASKKKKRASGPRRELPTFYYGELLEFVRNANFGPAYRVDEQGQCVQLEGRLQDYLPLLMDQGITGNTVMVRLFSIYHNYHGTQNPNSKQYFRATDEMARYLQDTFRSIEQADIAEPRTAALNLQIDRSQVQLTPDGTRYYLPSTTPDAYAFGDVMRIISRSHIKKEDLNAEQRSVAADPNIVAEVINERDIVATTLNCIRPPPAPKSPSRRVVRRAPVVPQVVARPIADRKPVPRQQQVQAQAQQQPIQQPNIIQPIGAQGLRRLGQQAQQQ